MAHPRDEDIYPVGTTVMLKKTGEIAVIRDQTFVMDDKNFLHYLGEIKGRGSGLWCIIHDQVELVNEKAGG